MTDGEAREEEHCQTATDDGDCLWKYRALILVENMIIFLKFVLRN